MKTGGKLHDILIKIYYYFQSGFQFSGIINFALLTLIASEKLQSIAQPYIGKIETNRFALIFMLSVFLGITVFGFFMDKIIQFNERATIEKNKRDPNIMEINRKVNEMHEVIIRK